MINREDSAKAVFSYFTRMRPLSDFCEVLFSYEKK